MVKLYENSWALIIAINKLSNNDIPLPELKNPINDAKAIENVLVDKCNFPRGNVYSLLEEKATKDEITDVIENILATKVKECDRFFVFFAGHAITRPKTGRQDKRGYLVIRDSKWKDEEHPKYNTLLNINNFVSETVGLLSARQFLFVLDCCFSGIAGNVSTYDRSADPPPEILQKYAQERQSVQIITASSNVESILDSGKDPNHSMFTQAIIDFLEGDNFSDFPELFISAKKLHGKIKNQVTQDAHVYGDGRSQEPQFYRVENLDQFGEFVIRELDPSEVRSTEKSKKIQISKNDKFFFTAELLHIANNLDVIIQINKQISESDTAAFTASSIFELIIQTLEKDEFIQTKLSELQKKEGLSDSQTQEVFNYLCVNVFVNGVKNGYSHPIMPNKSLFEETNTNQNVINGDNNE